MRITLAMMLALAACASDEGARTSTPATALDASHPAAWMRLFVQQAGAANSTPPIAARIYAYAGVALYEAALPGMPEHRSLAGELVGLGSLPRATGGAPYDWPSAQAGAAERVSRVLLSTASAPAFRALLEQQLGSRKAAGVPAEVIARSLAFGEEIGDAIAEWSLDDGFATRDRPFAPPAGRPELWVPTMPHLPPVEPYWGTLRPFVVPPGECRPPGPPPYSEEPTSEFYKNAHTVYQTVRDLSDEHRAITQFWADGPRTPTPAGHWLEILSLFGESLSMATASEAYALLGMAAADAFIGCWRTKFEVNLVRPETYIKRVIQPDWKPQIPTPQFPEYTSGHSTVSGAAATVLTAKLGAMRFTDGTHVSRGMAPRVFRSFQEAAVEAAQSRLYGGIHYPFGNQDGLEQGRCIGVWVLQHALTRK